MIYFELLSLIYFNSPSMFNDIQFIYFDLDDTLMDFSSASNEAFVRLMDYYDLPNDEQCFEIYQRGNHQTWQEFEQNLIYRKKYY